MRSKAVNLPYQVENVLSNKEILKDVTCTEFPTPGFLLLLLISSSVLAQGSQDQDSQDSENSQDSAQMIGGSDPNLVNPQNKQGYGRNIQTQLLPQPKTTVSSTKPSTTAVTDTMGEQSIQAVLQLGVLVCFLSMGIQIPD